MDDKSKMFLFNARILLLSSIILALLTACGNGNNDNDGSSRGVSTPGERGRSTDNSIIETYIYLAKSSYITYLTEFVQRAVVHEGRIYFCYVVESINESTSSTLVVESMMPDGTQLSRTEIELPFTRVSIANLRITDEGYLAFIIVDNKMTDSMFYSTVLKLKYTIDGDKIMSRKLSEFAARRHSPLMFDYAIIADSGDILLQTSVIGGEAAMYLFNYRFELLNQLEINTYQMATQTNDGRIVVSDGDALQGIDFEEGDLGEVYSVSVVGVRSMYPARAGELFDLYIDDGRYLFGYNIAASERTTILSWTEARVDFGFMYHLNFLDDGRISIFITHGDFATDSWRTEHVILTRTARAELSEYTVITLGVLQMGDFSLELAAVRDFNREHQNYQIQIVEYWDGTWTEEAFESARMRFSIDLMTGRAPDIILVPHEMREALIAQGLLADLYTFIDADMELCRTDFLPNVLGAMEASDGTLRTISYSFAVETMIGLADMVEDIESWTFADMLALIEQTENLDFEYILTHWFNAEWFLDHALQFSGNDFIDWDEHRAHLDSEEFMHLLEVASYFHHDERFWDGTSPIMRLLNGKQLLHMMYLSIPRDFQMYTGMLGDELTVLGLPTREGGVHLIHAHGGFAISEGSQHQKMAWDFIRRVLSPDLNMNQVWQFPLRLDLLEEQIAQAKTPLFIIDEDGNEVQSPSQSVGSGDFMVDIYAMTDAEEKILRYIIENATVMARFNETVSNMVREETRSFFAGERSANDVARVLQSRVQIYLYERG